MKLATSFVLVTVLSGLIGFAACTFLYVKPLQNRIDGATTFTRQLSQDATQAAGKGLTYSNATLAHNMTVLTEVLEGSRNPDGSPLD